MTNHDKYILDKIASLFKDPGYLLLWMGEGHKLGGIPLDKRASYDFLQTEFIKILPQIRNYIFHHNLNNTPIFNLFYTGKIDARFLEDVHDIFHTLYKSPPAYEEEKHYPVGVYYSHLPELIYLCDQLGINVKRKDNRPYVVDVVTVHVKFTHDE